MSRLMCHVQRFSGTMWNCVQKKKVCGFKLQCWNVKVLVVTFCCHLRVVEKVTVVLMIVSVLRYQMGVTEKKRLMERGCILCFYGNCHDYVKFCF